MISTDEAMRNKERILSILGVRGPSLPVQVAKSVNLSPLFASAFLSELKAEGKLKISDMKVGSSPLYYLQGQESMLENFSQHLNQREREAFELLKGERILEDEKQEPVVRVALRALKDFAVPLKINNNGETKLFWRYFSVPEPEVITLISKKDIEPAKLESKEEEKEMIETPEKIRVERTRKAKVQESEFGKKVREHLGSKDIEILEVFNEKKKEFEAKIRIDTLFGKQEFYLVAKDKKNIGDNDFAVALQRGQARKLPAVFMAGGELNAKAKEHLKEWGNLVRWEKARV